MKTIVVGCQKGGVCKTTTALAIADVLMKKGKKVLYIDADAQRNGTSVYHAQIDGVPTLYDVVLDPKDRIPVKDAIQHTDVGDIVAGDLLMIEGDLQLARDPKGTFRLKEAMKGLTGYDYVIIDTCPAANMLQQTCFKAADELIIPMGTDAFDAQGVSDTWQMVKDIQETGNPNLKIAGILLCRFKGRTNLAQQCLEDMQQISKKIKVKLFKTKIRDCVKVRESQAAAELLLDYAPKCTAALDYQDFVKEWLGGK